MRTRQRTNGFTLMEMLIVVAIIAILVAIAIPTVIRSLEKSRCAADNANIRAGLEKLIAEQFLGDNEEPVIIPIGCMKADWDGSTTFGNLPLTGNGLSGIGWEKGQEIYLRWSGDLSNGHAYIADKSGNPLNTKTTTE